ncbi:Card1-like endonuclease domain-containing protein [Sulfurimonas sp. ST-27]|uniref:Card1-like endonuclease domain-containing protein n=1 Tax=Sulfurimonas sp. ST-27 TaxID=3400152 RepID=UPI003AB76BBE
MLLISIIGDFHSSLFPLYNELKKRVTHHIVVNDDAFGERRKQRQIVKALEKFNIKKALNITTEAFVVDEDSVASIKRLIKRIEEIEPEMSQVYLNITDGLANIGLLLAMGLLERGGNFLSYDMYENSYNLITKKGMQNITLKNSLSIVEHFELKGFTVEQRGNKEFAHKYKYEILELFNTYSNELERLNRDISQQKSLQTNRYPRAYQLIKNMKIDIVNDGPLITGGLFEYYIYLLIKELPFDDIEVGTIVKQPFNNSINIINEFDILLMKNNHLHMIECKFKKNNNKSDLIYKYSALINLIDDDCKIMILTNEIQYKQDIYDTQNKKLTPYRRGILNNIILRGSVIHNKSEFLEEIQNLFLL